MEIEIQNLIDNASFYDTIRGLKWLEKVYYPHCESTDVIKRGKNEAELQKQHYE